MTTITGFITHALLPLVALAGDQTFAVAQAFVNGLARTPFGLLAFVDRLSAHERRNIELLLFDFTQRHSTYINRYCVLITLAR